GRQTLSIIREFSKTPNRSLGAPRRVPVDSNGNEIAKTPRKIPRTPLSKSSQQCQIDSAYITPSKTPCRIQVLPSQSRSHFISSKLYEHSQSSRELKSLNIPCEKEEKSNVHLNSEMVIEKESVLVVKDKFAGKENMPLKGKICLKGNTSARKEKILALLSRFQKRENLIRSPALRVEIKDSMDGCGKKRKASVPKSDTKSTSNQLQQCQKSDDPKSSAQPHINQLQQSKRSDDHVRKKLNV
ncbi:hypothetical protein KI387_007787, partial [Taxus chinensis]